MRKLDALVERYIFGLEERPYKYDKRDTEWYNPKITDHNESFIRHYPRRYTTNMEATWQIVEKLQFMDRVLTLSYHPVKGKWSADFELWKNGGEYLGEVVWAEHASATMAICLAALRAVGVSEEEIGAAVGNGGIPT